MKDRDFLIWLHQRLQNVYDENPLFDYMHKLRAIISITPKDRETKQYCKNYSLRSFQKEVDELRYD